MMKKDFIMHEMMYHADNEEYEEEHSRIEVSSIKSKRLVPVSSQYLPKNAPFFLNDITKKRTASRRGLDHTSFTKFGKLAS